MPSFSENDLERLDYRLLQNGFVSLYHSEQILSEDIKSLQDLGYDLKKIDCSSWQSEDDLHRSLARELDFPDYYGHNLNALNDCLSDLPIPSKGGLVISFSK